MSNVRVWTVDDDGDLLRGGYYPRGASGTGMADDEADELRAILERGQAPAAPSEGDGRRPVFDFRIAHDPSHVIIATADDGGYSVGLNSPERAAVFVDWANRHSADPASPAPLPPGVHRAPDGTLWLLPGSKMPASYEFRSRHTNEWETPIDSAMAAAVWSEGSAYEVRPVPPVPAASSPDPLPPGVHRAPTGELLCRGIDLPEGWAFYGPPETIGASDDESRPWWDWRDREADVRTGDAWYRVRPVPPVPEPEKVPWAEAIWNKRLIARTFEGREPFVAMFVDDATGTEFAATLEKIITDGDGYEPIDADGLVSVLPLGDPK